MFEGWTWQKWIGKVLLLILALGAFLVKEFGVAIPLWMIIVPAVTQVAQWFIAWLPEMAWQMVVGKGLLLAVSVGEVVLGGLGFEFELWLLLIPMVGALAQYIISKVPVPEE